MRLVFRRTKWCSSVNIFVTRWIQEWDGWFWRQWGLLEPRYSWAPSESWWWVHCMTNLLKLDRHKHISCDCHLHFRPHRDSCPRLCGHCAICPLGSLLVTRPTALHVTSLCCTLGRPPPTGNLHCLCYIVWAVQCELSVEFAWLTWQSVFAMPTHWLFPLVKS